MKNAVGREIPASLPGYKPIVPYAGPFATPPAPGSRKAGQKIGFSRPGGPSKVLRSLDEALEASGLRDG
ncbi:MAG: citrate lyase subunit alpha, partial [Deltaproteobacteria bacterium]|nr:citrate lyase subunit alpha [Deltaproteobacteria bacterium]